MSKKYGIFCENCNTLLNNEDNIFGTNLGQLYHSTCMGGINHGKSTDCQPQMLFKMNLKFADTPTLTTEAEREIMELKNSNNAARQSVQQLEAKIKTLEDALLVKDRLKSDVNKLMDCVVNLANTLSINVLDKSTDIVNKTSPDKSNKQASDENNLIGNNTSLTGVAEGENIEHNNSNNGMLQSVQQLEARIKILEDALLQTKSNGNKLTECVELAKESKVVDKSPNGGNKITQNSNANKQTHNINNLSGEQHKQTENVAASASGKHHTYTKSEEKQELLDLRCNCVLIENPERNCKSLDEASSYVRELAKQMTAQIADNSVIHIDLDYPSWYVYFRDAHSKQAFLKDRLSFTYDPPRGCLLRISDYTDCGIVDIANHPDFGYGNKEAIDVVDELAKKMRIGNIKNSIDHVDVYNAAPTFLTYSVRFKWENIKNAFLKNKDILKQFRDTENVIISDVGGHTSSQRSVHSFNMTAASANVIGVAELMGLSLSTDNIQRINVLNVRNFSYVGEDLQISLLVEFFSNDLKIKFLSKRSELKRIFKDCSSYIRISDIETEEGNIVSIKYYKGSGGVFPAMSFIGLSKQLGFPFTSDQTDRFIQLSQFLWEAC